jgi:hypothetical protein
MAGASYLAKEHSKRVKDVQYVHKNISFRTALALHRNLSFWRAGPNVQVSPVTECQEKSLTSQKLHNRIIRT